jgi:hypothetical protein
MSNSVTTALKELLEYGFHQSFQTWHLNECVKTEDKSALNVTTLSKG